MTPDCKPACEQNVAQPLPGVIPPCATCIDPDAPVPIEPTTVNTTVGRLRADADGNVAAGKMSVTFTNISTTDATDATVAGALVAPGESVSFSGYYDEVTRQMRRLPQIAYSASATAVLSITWVD